MIRIELFFALLTALVITVLFVSLLKIKVPKGGFWFIFILIFLVTLVGNRYIMPLGTPVYGIYWLPGFLAGLIVALIIAATQNNDKKIRSTTRSKVYEVDEDDEKVKENVALNVFFWIAVILLAVVLIFTIL